MSFLSGTATFRRFRADGVKPDPFGEEHLGRLVQYEAGRQRIASADGIETGWTAGGHIHDTTFTLDKNVNDGDVLTFDLRITTDRIPADRLKAYAAIELVGIAANNPRGLATPKQKREAKEIARARLEEEAKDGRFKKHTLVPVLWDRKTDEVWFGSHSFTHLDRFASLFEHTFGRAIHAITAGRIAESLLGGGTGHPEIGRPSAFIPDVTPEDIAWIPDAQSSDYLGNEFLLWLWFLSEGETDTIKLTDDSEATFMLARWLNLECPRGQTGHEKYAHEGPTRLPEAKRAIQSGKLPRLAGLTLVRHDRQYELKLHAETFAIGAMKLPAPSEESPHARRVERIESLRSAVETLDLMYAIFLKDRLTAVWPAMLERMQRWLKRGEQRSAA